MRNLTQPEVLAIANEASASLQRADELRPIGIAGAFRASRESDVQQGMAVFLDLMRHVGRAAGHWRVRRELLALGIDRSPREFAPARGPPSLW